MLAGLKRRQRLGVVEEGRGGDVDHVEVVATKERNQIVFIVDAEPGGRCQRCRPVSRGHADEPDPAHLREVLEREQAETAASDDPESNKALVHGRWPRG